MPAKSAGTTGKNKKRSFSDYMNMRTGGSSATNDVGGNARGRSLSSIPGVGGASGGLQEMNRFATQAATSNARNQNVGGGITGGGGGGGVVNAASIPPGGVGGASSNDPAFYNQVAANAAATKAGPGPNPRVGGNSALAQAVEEAKYGDAWSNPDQLAGLWFNQGGYNPYGSGYETVQNMAQEMPLMWLLMSGRENLLGGTPNYLDYANQYMTDATGGGALPNSYDRLNAIFGADQGSMAQSMLANPNLSANDQVGNLLATMETALGGVLPTPVLQMLLDETSYLGTQWAGQRFGDPLNQNGGLFMDYMRQAYPGGDPFRRIVRS